MIGPTLEDTVRGTTGEKWLAELGALIEEGGPHPMAAVLIAEWLWRYERGARFPRKDFRPGI